MGSGKTYWAEKLKKKHKIPAYDLDNLVEIMDERTIAEIYKEDGEDYFRKEEAKMLRLFKEKKQFILSCGGGTPCHHENMSWMNKNGVTIWIDEPIEILTERLKIESDHRPAIMGLNAQELAKWLATKLKEREPFYSQATYRLKNEQLSESTFNQIFKNHA